MGAAGMLIGGGVLGLGAASLMAKGKNRVSYDTASNFAVERPAVPAAPTAVEADTPDAVTRNAGMEAERERERQAALLRKQQAQEVFTSALGAEGMARTAKKTLLGG